MQRYGVRQCPSFVRYIPPSSDMLYDAEWIYKNPSLVPLTRLMVAGLRSILAFSKVDVRLRILDLIIPSIRHTYRYLHVLVSTPP
jgi:hypothetical protein